jgi:hypothetical protein
MVKHFVYRHCGKGTLTGISLPGRAAWLVAPDVVTTAAQRADEYIVLRSLPLVRQLSGRSHS